MNAVIDWRSYFRTVPGQSSCAKAAKAPHVKDSTCRKSYAKDAKGVGQASERVTFADLHTNIGTGGSQSLEAVFKGRAIELWSNALGERFWLVADDAAGTRLGESRGTVYTAAARRIVAVGDPAIVAEIHDWKRQFDGVVNPK